MAELAEFLLARIAEDETAARTVYSPGTWRSGTTYTAFVSVEAHSWTVVSDLERGDADFIARHDPARVLAECEAKRRIVELHPKILEAYPDPKAYCCSACSAGGEYPGGWPCATLCALTLPYADHPDYRDEWRASVTGSTRPAR